MDPTLTGRPAVTGPEVSGADRPRLARHVRLAVDRRRNSPVLLLPETVIVLNATGAAILELCDGRRSVAEIVAELGARYATVPEAEVRGYLSLLAGRRWVELADG